MSDLLLRRHYALEEEDAELASLLLKCAQDVRVIGMMLEEALSREIEKDAEIDALNFEVSDWHARVKSLTKGDYLE
jgi:hypothetical protein